MNGIFPASITPFRQDGSFNPDALTALMRRNLKEGAAGFFIGGSSAECFLLNEKEREAVFETACAFSGETDIIAHIGAMSTDEAIRYARAAKRYGAKYLAAVPPLYYPYTSAQTARYFYNISYSVDMPLMYYNFPANTGKVLDIGDPEMIKLLQSGAVWGIKHTCYDLYQMERIRNINPELVILNGYDEVMTAGLALGADGAIGSTFNALTPLFYKLYQFLKEGELNAARQMQVTANNIMQTFSSVGIIAAIKYTLTCQGIDAGEPRRPFTPLTDEQKAAVRKCVGIHNDN